MLSDFFKLDENDQIWWCHDTKYVGQHLFSFDKKRIYNVFLDYPHNLTKEQKELFDRENPDWARILKSRCNNGKK